MPLLVSNGETLLIRRRVDEPSAEAPPHARLVAHLVGTIEESFRDDKSGGFDLEATQLSDPKRLDTLLLAIAVAVLWIYELGEQVIRDERRKEIDPGYKRQLSVFQLGWRQLRRAISCTVLPAITL